MDPLVAAIIRFICIWYWCDLIPSASALNTMHTNTETHNGLHSFSFFLSFFFCLSGLHREEIKIGWVVNNVVAHNIIFIIWFKPDAILMCVYCIQTIWIYWLSVDPIWCPFSVNHRVHEDFLLRIWVSSIKYAALFHNAHRIVYIIVFNMFLLNYISDNMISLIKCRTVRILCGWPNPITNGFIELRCRTAFNDGGEGFCSVETLRLAEIDKNWS